MPVAVQRLPPDALPRGALGLAAVAVVAAHPLQDSHLLAAHLQDSKRHIQGIVILPLCVRLLATLPCRRSQSYLAKRRHRSPYHMCSTISSSVIAL